MGCCVDTCRGLCGFRIAGLDVGNYENLNPYLMKKTARQFRQTMSQRLEQLGPQTQQEVICEVVYEGDDPLVQNIAEDELRRCALVLRSFAAAVQNEIVGACLLNRPRDVTFYKYDYATSMILCLRRRASQEIVSAALVVFHGQNENSRSFEVIWVATMRKYRERGYACLLFGYIQQLAVVCKIDMVLVEASRTTVGFWLTQPVAPGSPRRVLVRGNDGGKRLSSGLKKTPTKLAKLKQGLSECDLYENQDPPEFLINYYDHDRPFRFSHTKSIHLWFPVGPNVDYLGTCLQVSNSKRRRASVAMSPTGPGHGGDKSARNSPAGRKGSSGNIYKLGANGKTTPRSPTPAARREGHSMGQIASAKKAARLLKERQRGRMARAKIKKSVTT
jgi:hypothetical protein